MTTCEKCSLTVPHQHACPNAGQHHLMESCPCGHAVHPLADWERDLLTASSTIAESTYQPYDPDLICPKCGHENVATEWHPGHHIWTAPGVTVARWDMYSDCLDWLLRTCQCCSYSWPEAPVDQDVR